MKQFLQVTMLLIMALSGTSTLKAQWYPDGLSHIYRGESFEDENFVYKRCRTEDNYVFLAASDFTRANAERLVFPTEVTYNGQTFEVAGIAHGGFANCEKLKEVIFPDIDSYFDIGWSAFWMCRKLGPTVRVPSNASFGVASFALCPSIQVLRLEKRDGVKFCYGYEYNTDNLGFHTIITGRDIDFAVNKTPVDRDRDSTVCLKGMENLTILDGTDVTNLFKFTRWHLVSLTMGKDVTGLPASMASHTKLQSITLTTETPPECPIFTYDQYKNIILTVPQNALDTYRKTKRWKNFRTINVSGIDAPAIEPSERTLTGRYDLHGRPVVPDYRGLVIERYSDGTAAKKIIGR